MSSLSNKEFGSRRSMFPSKLPNYVTRIITACFLAPLGVWVVLSGGIPFLLATLVCVSLAAYEWASMIYREHSNPAKFTLFGLLSFGGVMTTLVGHHGFSVILISASLTLLGVFLLASFLRQHILAASFGALYLTIPFGSFVFLREGTEHAVNIMLYVMVIVWGTDTAAYVAGKAYGGPAFSPKSSPGKTWTGVFAGVIYAGLAGVAGANLNHNSVVLWVSFAVTLSICSQLGDLLESIFKRQFGIKDMSNFIPGHGGVLDRIDGLIAAVCLTAVLQFIFPDFQSQLFGAKL